METRIALVGCAALLFLAGCSSLGVAGVRGSGAPTPAAPKPVPQVAASCRALSRGDLNHVIDARLSRGDAAKFLSGISIVDYEIVDPATNWLHGAIPGAPEGLAIYFFTYRQRYFVLFLKDRADGCADVLDALVLPRTSADYELGMGPVVVDNNHADPDVVVIYNKHWKGAFTEDVTSAFRPNWDTGKLETFAYQHIRINREQAPIVSAPSYPRPP